MLSGSQLVKRLIRCDLDSPIEDIVCRRELAKLFARSLTVAGNGRGSFSEIIEINIATFDLLVEGASNTATTVAIRIKQEGQVVWT